MKQYIMKVIISNVTTHNVTVPAESLFEAKEKVAKFFHIQTENIDFVDSVSMETPIPLPQYFLKQ